MLEHIIENDQVILAFDPKRGNVTAGNAQTLVASDRDGFWCYFDAGHPELVTRRGVFEKHPGITSEVEHGCTVWWLPTESVAKDSIEP